MIDWRLLARLHQQRVDDLLSRIAAALAADDANKARKALSNYVRLIQTHLKFQN